MIQTKIQVIIQLHFVTHALLFIYFAFLKNIKEVKHKRRKTMEVMQIGLYIKMQTHLHASGGYREQAVVQLRAFWMQVVLPVHGHR